MDSQPIRVASAWTDVLAATLYLPLAFMALASEANAQPPKDRYLVRLSQASLVRMVTESEKVDLMLRQGGLINFDNPTVGSFLDEIEIEHERFLSELAKTAPSVRVDREYKILFNGFTVAGADPADILMIQGVDKVFYADAIPYRAATEPALSSTDALTIWNTSGSDIFAGSGIKIAVIDSGVAMDNRLFSPNGLTMPSGYPKGETAFTNSKVIAARSYFRPDDPVDSELDERSPMDRNGHGSHCAGVAAGAAGTVFDSDGVSVEIGGVAPGARLMNYKVFYFAESGADWASDPELMAAFEDAVLDGAEIILCGLAAADLMGQYSPSAEAYTAAIDAGVVVILAAGDSGSGPGTISYPGVIERAITVGSLKSGSADNSQVETVSIFSSVGPTDENYLKPDLLAPGENVVSATIEDRCEARTGTSTAASAVAGAAAVLRQVHREWNPNKVKSALLGSASEPKDTALSCPIDSGAGILNLEKASQIEITAYPPSLALGQGFPGDVFDGELTLSGVSSENRKATAFWKHSKDVSAEPANGAKITADGNIPVSIQTLRSDPPGEYVGYLEFRNTEGTLLLSAPYHFRLIPSDKKDLLLLDLSFLEERQTALALIYSEMAELAGYEWDLVRIADKSPALKLAELLKYDAAVVFTGNDQTIHTRKTGVQVLDVLTSYVRKGGRLVVAGQGPLRGSTHQRMLAMTGMHTDIGFPLLDPDTNRVLNLESYVAEPTGDGTLVLRLPVDISPEGDGQGNLEMFGEISAVQEPWLTRHWAEPFLKMEGAHFSTNGYIGMIVDPFKWYGVDYEAEAFSHRVVWLGFGFERINSLSPDAEGPQELFDAVLEWATDKLSIDVKADVERHDVVVHVSAEEGSIQTAVFDFGDGSERISSTSPVSYHHYDSPGTKAIAVIGRSSLGAAAIERIEVEISDVDVGTHIGDAGIGDKMEEFASRERDCACTVVGSYQSVSMVAASVGAILDF